MSMRKTVIKLEPSECTMTVGEIRTNYRYSEATDLRDDVRDYIYDLIGEHRLKFSGECGRCGNSCRRSDVLVRHQEILAFQQRFGISETAFREKYLEPAKTGLARFWWSTRTAKKMEHTAPAAACTTFDRAVAANI
jgi:hypothetical protein